MCNCSDKCENEKCRIAVAVEDNFAPCVFPRKMFDVEIRSRDGSFELSGKVASGGSQVFDLPCDSCGDGNTEYTVTVTGDMLSSPRSQTRRVCCCCGSTSGVTFIFMTYEPDCDDGYSPHCPCPKPCPPKPCTTSCTNFSVEQTSCFSSPSIEFAPKPPACPCEDYLI